jgi:hypothetical protein
MIMAKFPCPCCGHLTVTDERTYDLCDVCLWENDLDQLADPTSPIGANGYSLTAGQENYIKSGASHPDFLEKVRPPLDSEPLENGWRPVDLIIDRFEPRLIETGETGWTLDTQYYWRPNYWLAVP